MRVAGRLRNDSNIHRPWIGMDDRLVGALRVRSLTKPCPMNHETQPVKQLSERAVGEFLNEDPRLSQRGTIQWLRTGIWRWESSDGLAVATSDGRTIEKARTVRGEAWDASQKLE